MVILHEILNQLADTFISRALCDKYSSIMKIRSGCKIVSIWKHCKKKTDLSGRISHFITVNFKISCSINVIILHAKNLKQNKCLSYFNNKRSLFKIFQKNFNISSFCIL